MLFHSYICPLTSESHNMTISQSPFELLTSVTIVTTGSVLACSSVFS